MKNLIKLTLLSILVIYGSRSHAQRGEMLEKVEARKVAYITEALNLSVQEAQVFWPVYNAHQSKIKAIKDRYPSPKLEDIEKFSDTEAAKAVQDYLRKQQEENQALQNYVDQVSEVLPPQKVAKLISLEAAFKRKLLKAVQKRKARQDRMAERRRE